MVDSGARRSAGRDYPLSQLYEVQSAVKLSANDAAAGIANLPTEVNTGLIKITKDNVG